MDAMVSKAKEIFSVHHVMAFLLCSVVAYLFRANVSYELKPVWRKRLEYRDFINGQFPTINDKLPPPIITDLESDGINEIVLITNDLKLSILALPDDDDDDDDHHDNEDNSLPHVTVKDRVQLPFTQGKRKSWPVVMTTGYTVPYLSMLQVRKQNIVIVTDDWIVLCYSPDLQLLWQQKLQEVGHLRDTYSMKAMAAIITSHNVMKNDEGLVIIGGSYTHKTHKNKLSVSHNITEQLNNTTEEDEIKHFSTFALSGRNGSVRWHHLPGDFGESSSITKNTDTEHHWKLGLKRHRLHTGELPWEFYKDEILRHMPHMWQGLDDTRLTLGKFHKRKDVSTDLEDDTDTATMSALKPEHIIGYAYGGQRPHSQHEHIQNPNAIIINNHNGIEVLNLLTGRPMTHFQLPDDSSIYTDIDFDGIIERVTWGQDAGGSPCDVDIWKFYPVKEVIERLSVCKSKRLFFTTSWFYNEDIRKKIPPLIIKSIAKKTGMLRFLLGHHLSELKNYDIVTFGGYGRVTSLDKEGEINWQVVIPASWVELSNTVKQDNNPESNLYREFHQSFSPSRQRASLEVSGEKNLVAVIGWQNVALVDLKEGKLLAEHSIPAPPTGPLVVGDFDNDGINDLIVTCKRGYIGFAVKRQWNHMYTAMYVTAVVLLILLTAHLLMPDDHEEDEDD